ncbi:alpha/beta hydrolase [Paraburkholderia sp.]|uniref:alpha/beta fold hydrolase n=1 Tax=Paraburkholderia sp. TaxID=1926495 RepID=UPI002D3479DF|nr:alpha/beta hydrolase [Paraburkholderia sp.]HZZ05350.1 alpha/beta hydrolase [Paraburkholderia sp.]
MSGAVRELFVPASTGALHALEFGRDTGEYPPLICLHGVTGSAWLWHDVAQELGKTRRVIALDLRGHGESYWPELHAYLTDDHIDDLETLVQSLDLPLFDLAGLSWGALIAIGYTARARARVRQLAVVDVEPNFERGEKEVDARPTFFQHRIAALNYERKANPMASDALLDMYAFHSIRPIVGGWERKHDPFFFSCWPFRRDNYWNALREIDRHMLFVHGERSFVRGAVMRQMAASARRGKFCEIAGSGHLVPLERPIELTDALRQFFTTVGSITANTDCAD